jgi:hypothetical protein
MKSDLTDQWIVDEFLKKSAFSNEGLFVYPEGCRKPELKTVAGELVCASLREYLYISRLALHYRNKSGEYIRLPWADIAAVNFIWRETEEGESVCPMRYKTVSGEIHVAMLFETPHNFLEVHERCIRELGNGGKNVRFRVEGERVGQLGEHFEEWLKKQNRSNWQEGGTVLLSIADTCDRAIASGTLTPEQRKTIIDAASHKDSLVWGNTVDMIRELQQRGFDFGKTLREMSASKKANLRFSAMCCVIDETDPEFATEILAAGLSDRSAKVRWKAADKASTMRKLELLPAMEAALAIEKNKSIRDSLAFRWATFVTVTS